MLAPGASENTKFMRQTKSHMSEPFKAFFNTVISTTELKYLLFCSNCPIVCFFVDDKSSRSNSNGEKYNRLGIIPQIGH